MHALWAFWLVLEQGHLSVTPRTHNAGHRFIGGHMAGAFSPNDPVFWLHHANVDRIWGALARSSASRESWFDLRRPLAGP